MKKPRILVILISILAGAIIFVIGYFAIGKITNAMANNVVKSQIDDYLRQRQQHLLSQGENIVDPFGEDAVAHILFIGLDSRAGQSHGHCDAIQLIEIDKQNNSVQITAVPRGTYSPLPLGIGATSTDYYVSNACGLVSLEYGVKQIEHILGKKADYMVIAGFSEVIGMLKYLNLPTTPTLQWLRHRKGYAVGEPQRAHNHSTFLKKLFVTYTPKDDSTVNSTLQYILYKLVQTDLSFRQTEEIAIALKQMNLGEHPERVTLSMRPMYAVKDIEYDAQNVVTDVQAMLSPIRHLLSPEDYAQSTLESIQTILLKTIEKQKNNSDFISWAFENNIWLQMQDEEISQQIQYDIITTYLSQLTNRADRMQILSDYIIEMEYRELNEWSEKGKGLLEKELPS